jgi:hypothetical protein
VHNLGLFLGGTYHFHLQCRNQPSKKPARNRCLGRAIRSSETSVRIRTTRLYIPLVPLHSLWTTPVSQQLLACFRKLLLEPLPIRDTMFTSTASGCSRHSPLSETISTVNKSQVYKSVCFHSNHAYAFLEGVATSTTPGRFDIAYSGESKCGRWLEWRSCSE